MEDETITTGVDVLLDLLKKTDKVPLFEAANQLKIPVDTLQSWVDFLVEERIIGIEYKFTKPYIFLNKEQPKKKSTSSTSQLKELKKDYVARAKQKMVPEEKIHSLWDSHVHQELNALEPFFVELAQKKGITDTHERKRLWKEYSTMLLKKIDGL